VTLYGAQLHIMQMATSLNIACLSQIGSARNVPGIIQGCLQLAEIWACLVSTLYKWCVT